MGDFGMTEYEYAALFFQVSETAHAAIANFLTVVFAMIVVSYLAAHRAGSLRDQLAAHRLHAILAGARV